MNRKSAEERAKIINCLVEGNSIRSTTRLTGASKNTVAKLLCEIGEACAWHQDKVMRNLKCRRLECDEIWSFVYSKQKNVPENKKGEAGDIWTWVAIDAETKLVPSWRLGNRDARTAQEFILDLQGRLKDKVQLTTDGNSLYVEAVDAAFGPDIDYAMLIKVYGGEVEGQRKYSQPPFVAAKKNVVVGHPDEKFISTSYAERQNLSMRMAMRRFTRLTNAFSKKIENHNHAIALYFMHYNFVRIHKTLKVTPAMAAGVTDQLWSVLDIARMLD